MIKADWIALDWGTTRLRAFAMTDDGTVLHRAASDDGMNGLRPDEFEPALLALIEPWLSDAPVDVLAAGMVGARQGWKEAPYLSTPTEPHDPHSFLRIEAGDTRLRVVIAPGVSQSSPADVMRGEETQIAGYLVHDPKFDGVLCLPGTHTKWARISAGEIVGFKTFMTGEMFALLSQHSVLRHSMDDGWDDSAFAAGAEAGLTSPETLSSQLFAIRAGDLLSGAGEGAARAHLSGLLIGAELAAAKGWWLGQRVALIGAEESASLYQRALDAEGVTAPLLSAEEATLAGLGAARDLFRSQP